MIKVKSFNKPDSVMKPPKTRVEVVKIGGGTLMRNVFEPGWKWSEHVKPTAKTDSCQAHHVLCMVSGRLKVVMDDGTEMEIGPDDVCNIPPGHDAWVVGDEAVVAIDVANYSSS
jgi:mannose-6-phosphate isomerase-like protein (cupin superfamily)